MPDYPPKFKQYVCNSICKAQYLVKTRTYLPTENLVGSELEPEMF